MKVSKLTALSLSSGNDISAQVTMRYRLQSDPDVDASYTAVTATKVVLGITTYDLDPATLPVGTYVIHQYFTADGSSTGTKYTIDVEDDEPM